jgi:tripartite-type tricarboxylate transporter receptor subunit TctC
MELFLQTTETKITHIPYKGGASALVDLTAGHVSVMFNNILVGLPVVRRGQLRVLGVSSASRSEAAPDIPTISEAGVPNFENTTWTGVLAPRGINRNLISSLQKNIISALRIPAVRQHLKNDGAEIVGNTPEQFYAQIESELSKWRVVAQAAGIEPQ